MAPPCANCIQMGFICPQTSASGPCIRCTARRVTCVRNGLSLETEHLHVDGEVKVWYFPATHFRIKHYNIPIDRADPRRYDDDGDPWQRKERQYHEQRVKLLRKFGMHPSWTHDFPQAQPLPGDREKTDSEYRPYYYLDSPFGEPGQGDPGQFFPGGEPVYDPLPANSTYRKWLTIPGNDSINDAVTKLASHLRHNRLSEESCPASEVTHDQQVPLPRYPAVIACRRICGLDMRYMTPELIPGTYQVRWYWHFSNPKHSSETRNALFMPAWRDPLAESYEVSLPNRPLYLKLRHVVMTRERGKYKKTNGVDAMIAKQRWLGPLDQEVNPHMDVHGVLQESEYGEWNCKNGDYQDNLVNRGWRQVEPTWKSGCAIHGHNDINMIITKKNHRVLLLASYFNGFWAGRFRFAGVTITKVT